MLASGILFVSFVYYLSVLVNKVIDNESILI